MTSVAVDFHTGLLGFELDQRHADAMAIVRRGDLRLRLAGPGASASRVAEVSIR
jgi:hypothetical protein